MLGMPTLIELRGLEETVQLCSRLGLSFVELNMNMPTFCPEELDAARVKRLSDESGIEFTLHLPEEIDLASFQPPIREGHLARCKQAIQWAADSGITLANIHMNFGVYFTLPDHKVWIYERHEDRYLTNILDSFPQLYRTAADRGVMLAIENASDFHLPFIQRALKRLSESQGFALTWDIGHDASSRYQDREVLMQYDPRIRHMHLHDYDGKSNHQVPMTGSVDIRSALAFAEERQLRVVIEVKAVEALTESARRLRSDC